MKSQGRTDEKNLLEQLRDGDQHAFTVLYNRYAAQLAAKLIKLFRDEAEAQDVLQDTFIKVWEHRAQLDAEKPFGAFLFAVAANRANNLFRKQLRETTHRMRALHGKEEGYTHVEEQLTLKENYALLDSALEQLTPKQREVFVLHRLEGKSYREIAELLQISESTISNHLRQATKRIQAWMNTGPALGAVILFHYLMLG